MSLGLNAWACAVSLGKSLGLIPGLNVWACGAITAPLPLIGNPGAGTVMPLPGAVPAYRGLPIVRETCRCIATADNGISGLRGLGGDEPRATVAFGGATFTANAKEACRDTVRGGGDVALGTA